MPWTREDEKRLQAMRENLAECELDRLKHLNELSAVLNRLHIGVHRVPSAPVAFSSLPPAMPNKAPSYEAAEALLLQADAIRDLLAPFDSGVRAAAGPA